MGLIPRTPRTNLFWLGFLLLTVSAVIPVRPGNGAPPEKNARPPWHFAVSGDSRNCGDVVMPAIAEKVRANRPTGYTLYAVGKDG
jgi:hypothetical protein